MLLMSSTHFNALQIFKLTIQPASVEAERAFSTCGLLLRLYNRCVVLHRECVAKAGNGKNAWFSSYMQRWFYSDLIGCF